MRRRMTARAAVESTMTTTTSTTSTSTTTTTNNGSIIQERMVSLPNGVSMQVICGIPHHILTLPQQTDIVPTTPIVILLHGSFHSAWCYQEHYIPYLIQPSSQEPLLELPSKVDCIVVAPSWRGTAGTRLPQRTTHTKPHQKKKIQIQDHVDDLYHFLQCIPTLLQNIIQENNSHPNTTTTTTFSNLRLYLVCHSFAGIVVMKYLEKYYSNTNPPVALAGIIPMCSIPPSGNGKMTLRFLRRSFRQSYQITIGFAMKQCCTNIPLCRTLFFDDTMDDTTIQRYQSYFQRDSKITIDVLDLAKQLPSKQVHAENGTATFIHRGDNDNDSRTVTFPPCCVIGAKDDSIVDAEAVLETARYFACFHPNDDDDTSVRVPNVTWIDSAHDVMLGPRWIHGATAIVQWIQQQEENT